MPFSDLFELSSTGDGKLHFFSLYSRNQLYLSIGLLAPSLVFLTYLFIQLYRCVCTRNYAEWRSQLSSSSGWSLLHPRSLLDFTTRRSSTGAEKNYRIDISMLNFDREKERFGSEKQFLRANQDIDLVAASVKTSLVATASMSGDIRVYDALSCEVLTYVKRSKTKADWFSAYRLNEVPAGSLECILIRTDFDQFDYKSDQS